MPMSHHFCLFNNLISYTNVIYKRYEKELAIQGCTIPKHIKMYNFDKKVFFLLKTYSDDISGHFFYINSLEGTYYLTFEHIKAQSF